MRTHAALSAGARGGRTRYLGWYEPAHYVLEANAATDRAAISGLTFSIVTPDGGAHWDGAELRFSAGVARRTVPDDEALQAWWRAHHERLLRHARIGTAIPEAETAR